MALKSILLGALVIGCSGAATAQVIIQQPQPVIVAAPAVMVQEPAPAPYYVTRVYVPQGIIQTTAAQAAPFNPAPTATYIETTTDRQTVKAINGYDVIFEDGHGPVTSHGLFISTRDEGSADIGRAVERMWPLSVGKSETVNLSSSAPTTITFSVLRTEIIAVPAGSFYTYVVERRERSTSDGSERIATSWYAPSIGAVVKFVDQTARAGVKLQPSYELVTIRLPAPPAGAMLVPITRRADTAENQQQFCQERGTILRMTDGRVLYFDCGTYVQADRMGYDHWLLVR